MEKFRTSLLCAAVSMLVACGGSDNNDSGTDSSLFTLKEIESQTLPEFDLQQTQTTDLLEILTNIGIFNDDVEAKLLAQQNWIEMTVPTTPFYEDEDEDCTSGTSNEGRFIQVSCNDGETLFTNMEIVIHDMSDTVIDIEARSYSTLPLTMATSPSSVTFNSNGVVELFNTTPTSNQITLHYSLNYLVQLVSEDTQQTPEQSYFAIEKTMVLDKSTLIAMPYEDTQNINYLTLAQPFTFKATLSFNSYGETPSLFWLPDQLYGQFDIEILPRSAAAIEADEGTPNMIQISASNSQYCIFGNTTVATQNDIGATNFRFDEDCDGISERGIIPVATGGVSE